MNDTHRAGLWRALLLAAVALSATASLLPAAPFTPRSWRGTMQVEGGAAVEGKLLIWNRDKNHDFIDDLLADRDPAERVDIVVDFNRCVTCSDEDEEEIITYLRSIGRVDHISEIVTFAVVLEVEVGELAAVAARSEVAMVEWFDPAQGMLETSVAAVRTMASATFTPNTVQDAFPAIDGTGVTIAVIDSGVDNAGGAGTTNAMFPAGTIVNGANCLANPCTVGDPDDDHSHGSHVAGIALGRQINCGAAGSTCRGVAPGARLVDIKVLDSTNSCVGASCTRGLELAITNRAAWGIDVMNVSIGNCSASNGQNAVAQLLNTAASLGMVVVVAAGNTTNCGLPNGSALVNSWASATNAITVGAIDDSATVQLTDDALAGFSLLGPRLTDNDGDARDEQKPEISAPGASVRSANFDTANGTTLKSGTSMAAPHVAGAAALILQASPGINVGSVKEVLLATAAQSNKPGAHPGYDVGWGFGFLDTFAALNRATITDVGRPTDPPYAPCSAGWCSPHISTATPPQINVANTITANIRNFSATGANNARVCFGAYVFSNNFNRFFELGCQMVNLAGNVTTAVNHPWTPSPALIPPGFPAGTDIHTCLKVSVDYAFDTNFANNALQRNTSVAQASIARVPFRLENNLPEAQRVRLEIEQKGGWDIRVLEHGEPIRELAWELEQGDCPIDLVIELEPPDDARRGDKTLAVVRAVTDGGEDFGGVVVEGVVAHPTDEGEPEDLWRYWWLWLAIALVFFWLLRRKPRKGAID